MVLKMNYHKDGWKILHSVVSISKKDLPNVSLKLSGAREACPSKLSRTENKLSLISVCAWIIQKKLFHSHRFFDLKTAPNSDSNFMNKQLLFDVKLINKAIWKSGLSKAIKDALL